MQELKNIYEAINALKDKEILVTNKNDRFILSKDKILHLFNGNSIKMELNDFKELYKDVTFYIYEDNNIYIDNEKDEAYYRYYKK